MKKTILVVGGSGYIGSHACKALHNAGYTPVVFDNLVYGHKSAVKWGPLVVGDIIDRKALDSVFEEYKPAGVMHFAAYISVGESVVNPGKYYFNNVAGTISLLEAVRDFGIRSFVFSSTAATYGIPQEIPIPVDHTQNPINPYGWSKLMIEQILRDFEYAHGIKHAALRYFNASGADPESEIGEMHNPETHLIPLVIMAAQGLRPDIKVFGTDYPTPDGTAIRDYIHVTDLAEAHVGALEKLMSGAESFSLNMGTGTGHSVREVIQMVEKVSGLKVPFSEIERREGDPPFLVADGSLAYEKLNWKPRLSDLETIASTAWKWHEKIKTEKTDK